VTVVAPDTPPAPLTGEDGSPKLASLAGVKKLGARRQLSAEVEESVREMILTGRLLAGEHLRTERLAEQLGVSPTPVREGLQALRSQGFLTLEPHKGFRVVGLRRADIDDIFMAQAYLSAELARRAAPRLTERQIEELASVDARLSAAAEADDADTVQDLHFEFHRMIKKAADAPKLTMLLAIALRHVPRNFFRANHVYPAPEGREEIIAAIRSGDAHRAATAMQGYIEYIGQILKDFLDAGGATASC